MENKEGGGWAFPCLKAEDKKSQAQVLVISNLQSGFQGQGRQEENFIYVEGENQSVEEKALDFSLVVDVEITGYNSTSIEIPADLDSYNDISSNRES